MHPPSRELMLISESIAREPPRVARWRRFTDALRGKCAELAALPGQPGRVRPELRADIPDTPLGTRFSFSVI